MLGRGHCATTALAWVALAPMVVTMDPLGLALSALIAAGAGVAPDIDAPREHAFDLKTGRVEVKVGATAAETHGMPSRAVAHGVAWACGGHRHGTHWLASGALVGALVGLGGTVAPSWALALALAICGAWPLRLFIPRRYDPAFWAPLAAIALGVASYIWAVPAPWLGWCVGFGWLVHIAGDWVCAGSGVPLFGPLDTRRHALGLYEIGGWFEVKVLTPACAAFVPVVLAWRILA